MILDLAYYGNPILRQKAEPVQKITAEIRTLIEDMIETMFDRNGMGLAATQIHKNVRIFVMCVPVRNDDGSWDRGEMHVFVNPKIVDYSEETESHEEGCLSIPNLHGNVIRPHKVKVEALNEKGERVVKEFSGLEAACVCHENDHLNGVLYIDRMDKKERAKLEKELREIKAKYKSKV